MANSRTDRHFLFVIDGSRERGRGPYAESQSGRRPDVPAAEGVGQPRVGAPRTEDGAFAVSQDIRSCATGLANAGGKRAERWKTTTHFLWASRLACPVARSRPPMTIVEGFTTDDNRLLHDPTCQDVDGHPT
jgi:hypothetical protein